MPAASLFNTEPTTEPATAPERFGLELKPGLPSLLSLALSVAGHAGVITLLMNVRFPVSAPPLVAEANASPTEIRIDKKLYYVARIEASRNTPPPLTPPKLVNPMAAPSGRAPLPRPVEPPEVEAPPSPAVPEPDPARQMIKRELARAFIPPEVKRTPRAEQALIQPMSPPDLVPPPVPLPTFRVMTPQLPRIPRKFVAPGRTAPRPPAQTPNVAPMPMELVHALPSPTPAQPRLSLPRTPPPPDPVKAPEGPPPAPEGEPLNILSLSNRNVPLTDKLVIPPGNIAPETTDNGGAAAGIPQPATPVAPAPTPAAPTAPSPARAASGSGPATASPQAASSAGTASPAAPPPAVASTIPPAETGSGRGTTGTGTGAAVTGATANGSPVVIIGGTDTGPPAAGTSTGAGVTVTGGGNTAGTGPPGGGVPGGRVAPGQVVTRAGGNYDTVVVQTSPVDQYPESRGLLTGRPIYSVYIALGTARDWTLFFCIPNERPAPNNTPVVQLGPPATPVKAPFATKLMRPDITLPSYERYVLVHGFVTPEGRFEALRVVRSIRPEIDRALLASLATWEFRPATRDNAPVRVEFLLSIPARGL